MGRAIQNPVLCLRGKTFSAAILSAVLALSISDALAQYSRTHTYEYHNDYAIWVVGAFKSEAIDGYTIESVTYGSLAEAQQIRVNGKLVQSLTYNYSPTDQLGAIATTADGNSNVTTYSDWKRGIPRVIRFPPTPEAPSGATKSAVVNDNGWIEAVADENGYTTVYSHDSMGRLEGVGYPTGDSVAWASTTISFAPSTVPVYGVAANHWRKVTQTGNRREVVIYDALWRPVVAESYDTADLNSTISQTVSRYDHRGRVTFASYPQRNLDPAVYNTWADPLVAPNALGVRTVYDALGRITSISQDSEHGSLITSTEYLTGFQTRVTNPRNFQTVLDYQAFDQPSYELMTGVTQFAGADTSATEIHRNNFGQPTRIRKRDAGGGLFIDRYYVYDSFLRLCKAVEPEVGATIMDYDEAGNLQWSASGLHHLTGTSACDTIAGRDSGRKVTRYYDARDRLSSLHFPDGRGNQTWHYWPDSLVRSIVTDNDAPGAGVVTNHYDYNKRRLLVGESSGQAGWYGWGIGYGYDANGSLSTQTYPTGLAISYAPNALGQATQARDQSGHYYASGATYYPNGALKQFTYGNGIAHAMAQNARQLPASVVDAGVSDLYTTFDANGNVADIYDVARGAFYNRHMQYDGLDRLTAAGSWVFGGDAWHRFTYDALDNMKSWKLPGVKDYADYVYNAQNQLANIKNSGGASVVGLEYEPQGSLANKNGQAYLFDYGNRLRSVAGKENYRYDGHGRRVLAWDVASTQSILSIYSNAGQIMYGEDYKNGKNQENIYLAGSVIAIREWSHSNGLTNKYQHTDALGSPVAVTNQAGTVIERNDYEPYGAVIGKPNYQGIGYTGHVQDSATGLTYMQQRYYDPNTGTFLSVDPLSSLDEPISAFHRYRYADSNPYRFTDPDGRASDSKTDPPPRTMDTIVVVAPPQPAREKIDPYRPDENSRPSFFRLTTFEALKIGVSSDQAVRNGALTRTVTMPAIIVGASAPIVTPIAASSKEVAVAAVTTKKGRESLYVACVVLVICTSGKAPSQRMRQQERLDQMREGMMRDTARRRPDVPDK